MKGKEFEMLQQSGQPALQDEKENWNSILKREKPSVHLSCRTQVVSVSSGHKGDFSSPFIGNCRLVEQHATSVLLVAC
jgi:hypothetical protein